MIFFSTYCRLNSLTERVLPGHQVFILLIFTQVLFALNGMKLTADFKLAKEDLKEPYLAPPKLLFRRFNNSAIAYLYVAAVNTIIQLDQQSLELTEIRVTGPKNFSIFRFPSLCYNYPQQNAPSLPPGYSPDNCGPRPTDVYVKAWATATAAKKSSEAFSYNEISHYDTFYPLNDDFQTMEDTLYACYNIFHGSCEGMRLTNISVTKTWNERPSDSSFFHQEFSPSIPIPVVNWNAALSATIVLDENYMYVAQEPDKIQDMTVVDIAPLAVRLRDFDYVSKQPNPESTMKFRVSDFPIQYKFSFHYTHVHVSDATKGIGSRIKQPRIYFVLQQPDNSEPKQWKTRISRICAEDTRFDSYTEITMACDGCITNEKIFNALHMATRGTVGSILAHERHSLVEDSSEAPQWSRKKQNSEDYSNVLLVAFAAQPIDRLVHSLSGTFFTQEHDFVPYLMRGTAISFYSIAEVDVRFDLVVSNCLSGIGRMRPNHFVGDEIPRRCTRDSSLLFRLIHYGYCPNHKPLNWPVSGSERSERLVAPSLMIIEENVTGMAITRVSDNFTVLVIATDEGLLAKYEVESSNRTRRLSTLRLTRRRKPLRGLTLDDSGLVAFAVSDDKVYRVELQDCASYRSCAACLAARDPYCGWCINKGLCSPKSHCLPPDDRELSSLGQDVALPPSSDLWLSYLSRPDLCPLITHVSPSGVESPSVAYRRRVGSSKDPLEAARYRPNPVILQLSRLLADSLPLALRGPQKPRLLCSFRPAPASLKHLAKSWAASGDYVASEELKTALQLIVPGEVIEQTDASLLFNSDEVQCSSPDPARLPPLPDDEPSLQMIISLEMTTSSAWVHHSQSIEPHARKPFTEVQSLAAGLFSVYDCSRLRDCRSCSRSRFGCLWCLSEERCLSVTDVQYGVLCPDLPGDPYVTGHQSTCSLVQTGSGCSCPSFIIEPTYLSVASLAAFSITAYVSNLKAFATRFVCSEGCFGEHVNGIYDPENSTVTCQFAEIDFSKVILTANFSNLPEPGKWHPNLDAGMQHGIVKCPVELFWFSDRDRHGPPMGHPVVNRKASALEIFETSRMAQYCDSCLALPARFHAGWCLPTGLSASGSCVTREKCLRRALPGTRWLQSSDTCLDPQILSVSPENATFDGLTTLIVRGVNFGSDLEKLILNLVGDTEVACRTSSDGFLPSRQFKCRLDEVPLSNAEKHLTARLKLTVVGVSSEVSSIPFHFLTPSVTGFIPSRGPIAGGTLIRVHGTNLNVGAAISVFLILNTPNTQSKTRCSVKLLTPQLLLCTTVGIQSAMSSREISDMEGIGIKSTLLLQHDATLTEFADYEFSFTPNPVIRRVPTSSVLMSGGTLIHVFGEFLDVIANPMVVFYYKGWEYVSSCQFTQGHLCCVSPALQMPENPSALHRTLRSAPVISSSSPVQEDFVGDHSARNGSVFSTTVLRSERLALLEPRFVAVGIDVDDKDFADPVASSSQPSLAGSRLTVPYGFVLDNVASALVVGTLEVLPNPRVLPFPDDLRIEPFASTPDENEDELASISYANLGNSSIVTHSRDHHLLRLHGHFESLVDAPTLQSPEELSVRIGNSHECYVTAVTAEELRCDLSRQGLQEDEEYEVKIRFGQYLEARPGRIQFKQISIFGDRGRMGIIVGGVLVVVFVLLSFIIFVIWCRFHRLERNLEVKFQQRWAEQEKCVARAFKQDFMELQTHMVEFAQDLNKSSLPFRDYQTYCLFSLFPDYHNELQRPRGLNCGTDIAITPALRGALSNGVVTDMTATLANPTLGHPLFSSFHVPRELHVDVHRGIQLLQSLLFNKHFVFVFVRAIEDDERVSARDRSHVASLLSIILQSDMVYLTSIIFILISDLLQRCHSYGGDSRLLTAFRRSESVVAKMLSNWLTFLLFNFIKDQIGGQLFFLYRALLQQLNTGPQDVVTGNARYTLDTGTLLKTDFLSPQIVLLVTDPEGLFNFGQEKLSVKVLLCDTITQAKAKILDAIYRNVPYSQQIKPQEVQLGKISETNGICPPPSHNIVCVMNDYDIKIRRDARLAATQGPPYPLNCLHDYGLTNNDVVALVRLNAHMTATLQPYHDSAPGRNLLKSHCHQNSSFDTSFSSAFGSTVRSCQPSTAAFINPSVGAPLNGGMVPIAETPLCYPVGISDSPDPHMWYHLEKPTPSSDSNHKQSVSYRSFDSRRRSKDICASSTSPAVYDDGYAQKPNCYCCAKTPASQTWRRRGHLSQLESGLPGVDAASLRRWLEADVSSLGEDFAGSSGRRRRVRRRKRRPRSTTSANRNDLLVSPDGQVESTLVDRQMTRLPCEVLLNRLLKTRMSVLQYMDNVVELIFGVQSSGPPACIKFLFDFLDKQAVHLRIRDPDIVHAWKSNCLHLRFWNQVLTNLDYIFDIPLARNTALESSFLSFSQAITYACSPVLDKVTKDSPFNKVLFAADIQRNWSRVKAYYEAIKNQSPLLEVEMNSLLLSHSEQHHNDFNVDWALYELFVRHMSRCSDKISSTLAAETANHEGSPPISRTADDFSLYAFPDAFVYDGLECHRANATSEWGPRHLLTSFEEVRRSFRLAGPNDVSCDGVCGFEDGSLCLSTPHLNGCCGSEDTFAPTQSPVVPGGYHKKCLRSSAPQSSSHCRGSGVGTATGIKCRPLLVPLERRELPPIPVTSSDEDLTHRTSQPQDTLTPAVAAATACNDFNHSTAMQFLPAHLDSNPFRNADLP